MEEQMASGKLETLFDTEALQLNLKSACPELLIYAGQKDIEVNGMPWELSSVRLEQIKSGMHSTI